MDKISKEHLRDNFNRYNVLKSVTSAWTAKPKIGGYVAMIYVTDDDGVLAHNVGILKSHDDAKQVLANYAASTLMSEGQSYSTIIPVTARLLSSPEQSRLTSGDVQLAYLFSCTVDGILAASTEAEHNTNAASSRRGPFSPHPVKSVAITALLALATVAALTACACAPKPAPVFVGDKMFVDGKVMVPAGGFLLSNGAMLGGNP